MLIKLAIISPTSRVERSKNIWSIITWTSQHRRNSSWMSQEVSNWLVNGLYWGYSPLILSFYQHFQRAIQVGGHFFWYQPGPAPLLWSYEAISHHNGDPTEASPFWPKDFANPLKINSSPLKNDGWKKPLSIWDGHFFRGELFNFEGVVGINKNPFWRGKLNTKRLNEQKAGGMSS